MKYNNYSDNFRKVKAEDKYATTNSSCLDFFSNAGSMRGTNCNADSYKDELIKMFIASYTEDKILTLQTLFYLRDVRKGMGERDAFRICMEYLAHYESKLAIESFDLIVKYGRYDDLLVFLNTPIESYVGAYFRNQIERDLENIKEEKPISLLGKWLPSINSKKDSTRHDALRMKDLLGLDCHQYRLLCSKLRRYLKLIENDLRNKNYTFDYSAVPGKAAFKYSKAFIRNDEKRYSEFLNKGEIKTNTLFPYEVARTYYHTYEEKEIEALNSTWDAFERIKVDKNIMVVRDGSGSMTCNKYLPLSVADSLTIIFSEQLKGPFKNKFMTFSSHPEIIDMSNKKTFTDKMDFLQNYDDCSNTDISKVYDTLFNYYSLTKNSKEYMIDKIIIVSDMEFDCIDDNDFSFNYFKNKFTKAGYIMPEVIFWNVNGAKTGIYSAQMNEKNVMQLSGFSQKLFELIVNMEIKNPYDSFLEIVSPYKENVEKLFERMEERD